MAILWIPSCFQWTYDAAALWVQRRVYIHIQLISLTIASLAGRGINFAVLDAWFGIVAPTQTINGGHCIPSELQIVHVYLNRSGAPDNTQHLAASAARPSVLLT